MRSVSSKMTPQQARQRPSESNSGSVTNIMITTMLFVASGLSPATTSLTQQYNSMGMGSNPYSHVTQGSGLERIALLHDLVARDDDDNDEDAQRLAALTGFGTLPSHDSDVMEIEEPVSSAPSVMSTDNESFNSVNEAAPLLTSSITLNNVRLVDETQNTIASVLQYLPLDSLMRIRQLSPSLNQAAEWISQAPAWANDRLIFTRWLEVPTPKPVVPNALPKPFWWRCMNCSSYSDNHQHCSACGTAINKSACRIFMGQLLKSCTADSVSHLIRSLLPGVTPLHIESHSNRSGNEKGCAWAYMNDASECERLIELNKRVYFDDDGEGSLGFWLVGAEDRMTLSRFAENRNLNVRNAVLPRQPLVVEYPMGSLLRTSLEARSQAYTEVEAGQWERGWYVARQQ